MRMSKSVCTLTSSGSSVELGGAQPQAKTEFVIKWADCVAGTRGAPYQTINQVEVSGQELKVKFRRRKSGYIVSIALNLVIPTSIV